MSKHVRIHLETQLLELCEGDRVVNTYSVSTARNGAGQEMGSHCTPLGRHTVCAKIGEACPEGAVFVGRRFTGEIFDTTLQQQFPERDWILTRILWLRGQEKGRNRLGDVDSMRRYIYIHGTPDSEPMGEPASHGCIRMRNEDVICLFDQVEIGAVVEILED